MPKPKSKVGGVRAGSGRKSKREDGVNSSIYVSAKVLQNLKARATENEESVSDLIEREERERMK